MKRKKTIAVIPPKIIPNVLSSRHESVRREVMIKIVEAARKATSGQLMLPVFTEKGAIEPGEVYDLAINESDLPSVKEILNEELEKYNLQTSNSNDVISFQSTEEPRARDQIANFGRISDSPPSM